MKYIKTYEKINLEDLKDFNLDKYLVFKYDMSNNIMFQIFKINEIQTYNDLIIVSPIYQYETKFSPNFVKSTKDFYHFKLKDIEERKIYQSDNLEDCKNFILNTVKYNL